LTSTVVVQCLFLVPVIGGCIYLLLDLWAVLRFRRRPLPPRLDAWPAVSILKPLYGVDKNLRENLRAACTLDYPVYEVVLSLQRRDDPALATALEVQREFGPDRVQVVVTELRLGGNGKMNNLTGSFPHVRYDTLVISDSDVRLTPGYLQAIVAPLADPGTGCVCTPYRAAEAGTWYEKLELLTLNADFIPSVIFASETGASIFCLGASCAFRRATLAQIGGFESLVNNLVEDFETGRRIARLGQRIVLVPYFVDTMVDLESPGHCWSHLVYWDQNTRVANPVGLFFTLFIRSVPFALAFAAARWFDPLGLAVLIAALLVRLGTAGIVLRWGLADRAGLRALPLLPLRDIAGLASWILAFTKRTVTWRGIDFKLGPRGRLEPRG
jgi:ceramide glucosyltransferase